MLLSAMQKGHFLLKRALFLITLKVGGHMPPVPPPFLRPWVKMTGREEPVVSFCLKEPPEFFWFFLVSVS